MNAPPLPETATVVIAGDVLASDFGAEVVILSLRDGVYYSLEEVGARIWGLLKSPIRVTAIRDVLISEYDVEGHRCLQDLQDVLGDLASRGLVNIESR